MDGWSNIRNEGVVNFLISKPETVFVKSLSTQANRHTANYLSQEIIKIMKEYGEQKFFVLIGDNAANMQKAFKIVKEAYPNVVPMGCVAHSLHLICQDFLKCDTLQKNYSYVVNIIKTIKNNQVLTATLAKIVKEKGIGEQLKLPAKTRWGSYFYSMQSVIKTKASLQVLAVHEQINLQADIKSQLLSEIFWEQLNLSSNIFGCITEWICKLESNEFNIHRVYFAFNEIKSKLELEFASTMILNDAEKTELSTIFNTRFKKTIKPIHLAANLLDPKAQGSDLDPSEEVDALEFIHTMSQALNINVMADFANYKARNDFWAKTFVWSCLDEISPVTWWKGICGSTQLSKLAVRILTAPCTSAATERSFSTHRFIPFKKRNRLTTQRAGKITYISCNWNLLFKNSLPPSAESTHSTQFENAMNSSLEGTQGDIPSTSTGIMHSTRYEFLSDTDSDSDYD